MKRKYSARTRLKKKERVPAIQSPYPEAVSRPAEAKEKGLLLRYQYFVAKLPGVTPEISPLVCEASALTTELTAHAWIVSRFYVKSRVKASMDRSFFYYLVPNA